MSAYTDKIDTQDQIPNLGSGTIRLSDEQIEIVSDIFSTGNQCMFSDMSVEWLLGHGFMLGAKFYRDFIDTNSGKQTP